MQTTLLYTEGMAYRRARQTNTTDNAAPSRIPTSTIPTLSASGDAASQTTPTVHDLTGALTGVKTSPVQNALMLLPYGTGTDGQTGNLRVYNWRCLVDPTLDAAGTKQQWFPVLLCELAFTVDSGLPGTAAGLIGTGSLFAKTITVTTGNANVSVEVLSPATTAIHAHALVDLKGALCVEIVLWRGTLTTDANCLFALL